MPYGNTGIRWFSTHPTHELADRLVSTLGIGGAIKACRNNHWHGIEVIIEQKRSYNSFS